MSFAAAAAAPAAGAPAPKPVPGSFELAPRAIVAPEPPLLAGAKAAGVTVGVWIAPDGSVESVEALRGTKEWRETVVATVKTWKFEPVVADGKPIPARVEVGFTQQGAKDVWIDFTPLPNLPGELHATKEWGLVPPAPLNTPDVILPLGVRGARNPVQVGIRYVIEPDGGTGRFKVLGATSEYAVRAALDLVAAFRFEPARVRDTAVPVEMEQMVGFVWSNELVPGLAGSVDVADPVFPYERLFGTQEARAKVRFRLNESGRPDKTEILEATCPEHPDFNDHLARAIRTWMAEQTVLLKPGEERVQEFAWTESPFGKARVRFHLGSDGAVERTEVLAASHPDFGAALAAAIETWTFAPQSAVENPVREYTHLFSVEEGYYGLRRYVAMARQGEVVSNSPKGLDGRPERLVSALYYPRSLYAEGVEGTAKVEFVLDRSGLVYLPRVLECSRPEFGWAALTSVNRWIFKPITKGGKPVDLRVVVPLKFAPPKRG